jgi:hypothetical protein
LKNIQSKLTSLAKAPLLKSQEEGKSSVKLLESERKHKGKKPANKSNNLTQVRLKILWD